MITPPEILQISNELLFLYFISIAASSCRAYFQPSSPIPPGVNDLGLEEGDECL
jgi:hypothetical protein